MTLRADSRSRVRRLSRGRRGLRTAAGSRPCRPGGRRFQRLERRVLGPEQRADVLRDDRHHCGHDAFGNLGRCAGHRGCRRRVSEDAQFGGAATGERVADDVHRRRGDRLVPRHLGRRPRMDGDRRPSRLPRAGGTTRFRMSAAVCCSKCRLIRMRWGPSWSKPCPRRTVRETTNGFPCQIPMAPTRSSA